MSAYLDEAISEFRRRDPSFLGLSPIGFASRDRLTAAYAELPAFRPWGRDGIASRLMVGIRSLAQRGLKVSQETDCQPLLGPLLCDSVLDGAAGEEGLIPLRAAGPRPALEEALKGYERRSAGGHDYLVRQSGSRWLVVINAIGIPLSLWSRLLGDADHDFRVMVVESGCSDLLAGGMHCDADLHAEVEGLRAALAAEDARDVLVVGWCSGGRVAVELAARERERVSDLVLVGATFRGAMSDEPARTQFEEDVHGVFSGVVRNPASADFLSRMLVQSQGLAPAVTDAALLLRLPDRNDVVALTAPFASGDQLKIYSTRLASDRGHDTAAALREVGVPILMVAGEHDHVVSNAATWAVLKASAPTARAVSVAGAGHYLHDLQYPYLRMLLEDVAAGREPTLCARVAPYDGA